MDRLTKKSFIVDILTDGKGLWSWHVGKVRVTHLQVPYINKEEDFGELCVYFDTNTWDTDRHGLIYTDRAWIRALRDELEDAGFDASDIGYSEQGMQGRNYVSLDVGKDFLASWKSQTEATV
jgi:hypothetical protein